MEGRADDPPRIRTELQTRSLPTEKHDGKLPGEHSFVQAKPDNIIVTALKKSEDDNELILRFYEWAGKQGDVTLQLPPGAKSPPKRT